MTLICYTPRRFQKRTQKIIDQAAEILTEYTDEPLSLRQLYYQFVSRDLFANRQANYDRLGDVISNARLAGLISWTAIEDRERTCHTAYVQDDPEAVLDNIAAHYAPDRWAEQDNYVECWIEKASLVRSIQTPCEKWDVPFMACKGYVSSSEMWQGSLRFRQAMRAGKSCHLIHLGDHDPSGIDMTRDNLDRMEVFGADIEIHRIALNMDQVRKHNPPPNPAKLTDSRVGNYIDNFGEKSWELDALTPTIIRELVEKQILELIDMPDWEKKSSEGQADKEMLQWIEMNSNKVFDFARNEIEFEDEG